MSRGIDWVALFAAGYHCEIREDGCVYRPAPRWANGHPVCAPCLKELVELDMIDYSPPPALPECGRRYNFAAKTIIV